SAALDVVQEAQCQASRRTLGVHMLEVPELVGVVHNSGRAGLLAVNAQSINLAVIRAANADEAGSNVANRAWRRRNCRSQGAAVVLLKRLGWHGGHALHNILREGAACARANRALNGCDRLVWSAKRAPVGDLAAKDLLNLRRTQIVDRCE